jgi:hypothetical protein
MIWGAVGHNFKSELNFVPPHVTIDGDYYFDEIILNFVAQADAVHPQYD